MLHIDDSQSLDHICHHYETFVEQHSKLQDWSKVSGVKRHKCGGSENGSEKMHKGGGNCLKHLVRGFLRRTKSAESLTAENG